MSNLTDLHLINNPNADTVRVNRGDIDIVIRLVNETIEDLTDEEIAALDRLDEVR